MVDAGRYQFMTFVTHKGSSLDNIKVLSARLICKLISVVTNKFIKTCLTSDMGLVIGETYDVSCAELRWREDRRVYFVPIFDHFHADVQFGFPHQHYHIDGRFVLDARMRHHFRLDDGRTNSVIIADHKTYELVGMVSRPTVCIGYYTGLVIPESPALYQQWYQSYIGKKCPGRKCPHFGTEMLERDGLLVCPLHHLVANSRTLKVIPL